MSNSKYHAVPTVVDNVRFASKREAARYGELKLLVKAGRVRNLKLHPRFALHVKGIVVGHYVADFTFNEKVGPFDVWSFVVEDTKGVRTQMFRWKAKHMKAEYGIGIREV